MNIENIVDINLDLKLMRNFYDKNRSSEIFELLNKNIIYEENVVVSLYGKNFNIPRRQVAYGDAGLVYKYSGNASCANKWPFFLKRIKKDVEKQTKLKFNFCLVNCYENGEHYISYHKDDEKELGFY